MGRGCDVRVGILNSVLIVTGHARPDSNLEVIQSAMKSRPNLQIRAFIDRPKLGSIASEDTLLRHLQLIERLRVLESENPNLTVVVRPENLGIAENLSLALDSVFEEFDHCTVLEDDCLPSGSFFDFIDFAIELDSKDPKFGTATGANHLFFPFNRLRNTAIASNLSHVWGWAISSDNWKSLKRFIAEAPSADDLLFMLQVIETEIVYEVYRKHWRGLLELAWSELTFDYKIQLWLWKEGKYCLTPGRNLIQNVGFDEVAAHSSQLPDHFQNRFTGAFQARRLVKPNPKLLSFWELSGFRAFAAKRLIHFELLKFWEKRVRP